jgi:hypothetical protein
MEKTVLNPQPNMQSGKKQPKSQQGITISKKGTTST